MCNYRIICYLSDMERYKQINTKENHKKLVDSGMFFEFHPELCGQWDKDKLYILGLELSLIDNVVVDGISGIDYPDFVDAYIESADYRGVEMSEEELGWLNDQSDFVYKCTLEHLT